jgi:hypothetical protein
VSQGGNIYLYVYDFPGERVNNRQFFIGKVYEKLIGLPATLYGVSSTAKQTITEKT